MFSQDNITKILPIPWFTFFFYHPHGWEKKKHTDAFWVLGFFVDLELIWNIRIFKSPNSMILKIHPLDDGVQCITLVLWTGECICMDNFRYFLLFLFTETELYASLRSMLAIQHPGWIMAITCGLYLQKTTSYHHIWGCYCLHLRPLDLFWVLLCVLANESSRPLGSSPKSSWLSGKEVCQRPPYSLGQFLVSLDLPSSTILVFV